jgi:hypothetical protein
MLMSAEQLHNGIQTSAGNLDYEQFTEEMNKLFQKVFASYDVCPRFMEDEPTGGDEEFAQLPVITFDTGDRVISESHGYQEPTLFERRRDPNDNGRVIDVYRQWFDVDMVFRIFHTTNTAARKLAEEFELFLFHYKDYLKHLGLSDLRFIKEKPPEVVTRWNKSLPQRTLVYRVRIERIFTLRAQVLTDVKTIVSEKDHGPFVQNSLAKKPSNSFIDEYNRQQRVQD